ncbi:hypothetical protein NSA47_13575 [Irregularibacter muris]|uniref:Uncharacterized protein n=1 Tax=Irregularibacter muris TaxID=1796619 RepID=A0AAE3HID4_9FIRM|nr:hypothetical protein [Irregularibacter muris]MCR1899994.1 hypothetical protein [Irregularibacter muris]
MELGVGLLIFGAVLVYGAKMITKIFQWISFLALKLIGFIIAVVGILYIFNII